MAIDTAETAAAGATARLDELTSSPLNPRERFDDESLDSLITSVQQFGIIEPIVVRPRADGGFEIVAGERRYRAAAQLGLDTVPIRVLDEISDERTLQLMLAENQERQNLTPIEEAQAYQRLNQAGHSQREIAAMFDKSQPRIANAMRLLGLPSEVVAAIGDGRLTPGHGEALLKFNKWPHIVLHLAARVIENNVPVARLAHVTCLGQHPFWYGRINAGPESPYIAIYREDGIAPSAFGSDWIANPDCPDGDRPDPYNHARLDLLGWATDAKAACAMLDQVKRQREADIAAAAAEATDPEKVAERERKAAERQATQEARREQERQARVQWVADQSNAALAATSEDGLTQRHLAVVAAHLMGGVWDGTVRTFVRAMLPDAVTAVAAGDWWISGAHQASQWPHIAALATADITTLHDVIALLLVTLHGDDTKQKPGSADAERMAATRAWLLGEDVELVGGDDAADDDGDGDE